MPKLEIGDEKGKDGIHDQEFQISGMMMFIHKA